MRGNRGVPVVGTGTCMGGASFTLSDGRHFETEDIDGSGDLQAHHLVSDGVSVCYKMSKCGVPAAFDPGLQTYHGKLVAIEPPNRNISVQVHATERGYMIDGEIVADALVRARFLKLERYNDPVRTQQGPRKSTRWLCKGTQLLWCKRWRSRQARMDAENQAAAQDPATLSATNTHSHECE